MRILIVDDNVTNLKLLTELVARMPDCEPVPFASPEAALAAMPGVDFDVAIIDYVMPVYTGVELVTEIVRFEEHVGKPVIFITADQDVATRIEALDAGAIDFMTKPVNPVEFQMRVRNIVDLAIARNRLAKDPESITREMEEEIIHRLVLAAGYKDPGARRRQLRISAFSDAIARAYGLSEADCADIRLVAPILLAGKTAVPDAHLLKRGEMTESEFRSLQPSRTLGGGTIVEDRASLLKLACEVASSHRERWDGQGYPMKLKGKEIPLAGRIVTVADNFDALTTERPFKTAWTPDVAAAHIANRSGQHFDPACVAAFLAALDGIKQLMRSDPGLGYTLAASA